MDLVDKCKSGIKGGATTFSFIVRPYKFQRELREALAPEWEVEFISADVLEDEVPAADVTVCGFAILAYLDKEKYHNLVVIPELDLMQYNYVAIKERLAEFL